MLTLPLARRWLVLGSFFAPSLLPTLDVVPEAAPRAVSCTVPLQPAAGGVLAADFVLGGVVQRATVDTGSPYLAIAEQSATHSRPSGLPPTREVYGQVEGEVRWRESDFRFACLAPQPVTFGTCDGRLLAETGGPLLGLIKHVRADSAAVRPTLLEQLTLQARDFGGRPVAAFAFDAPGGIFSLLSAPVCVCVCVRARAHACEQMHRLAYILVQARLPRQCASSCSHSTPHSKNQCRQAHALIRAVVVPSRRHRATV